MLDIERVRNHPTNRIWVNLTGAPEISGQFTSWTFLPMTVRIEYAYTMDDQGAPVWLCNTLEIRGPRVLKPGKDGEQRLGKDHGKRYWSCVSGRELLNEVTFGREYPLPEWLVSLVNELRPSGGLELAGDLN